ncbi:MAG: ATP-binding cassette domain-containing protein, partial [Lachnospiraceae bacterium]|nr:ATP-binding cassette domain-containing protein [Lachnospiraceae bacterium]
DEPTSQLDPIAASDFLNTVRKINIELGTTIIITEHRLEDIYHAADRVVVMDDGAVIADDTPRAVGAQLHREGHEMFAALPAPVRVFYGSGAEGDCPLTVREGRSWLTETFADRTVAKASLPDEPETDEDEDEKNAVLRVKEAWFRYEKDSPDIMCGVNFTVPRGQLYAIVGGNGAGKSTTLKAICGICPIYRGRIEVFGKDQKKYKSRELFKNCLAMLPQDPKSLFGKKTVQEELEEMTHDEEKIRETAEICEITDLLGSHPYDLSGGEQQRAALAKVLLTEPQLLLLDEPTKGIDNFFKVKFAAILARLKERGITIVMVSHDIEFCAEYADRVSMFFDGQILTSDTPRRFFRKNSFYTTAANRMSRCVFENAITAGDVVELYKENI